MKIQGTNPDSIVKLYAGTAGGCQSQHLHWWMPAAPVLAVLCRGRLLGAPEVWCDMFRNLGTWLLETQPLLKVKSYKLTVELYLKENTQSSPLPNSSKFIVNALCVWWVMCMVGILHDTVFLHISSQLPAKGLFIP